VTYDECDTGNHFTTEGHARGRDWEVGVSFQGSAPASESTIGEIVEARATKDRP
jgi:hypothetical protein